MRSLIVAIASLLTIFTLIFTFPSYATCATCQVLTDEPGFSISAVPVSDPAVTAKGYFVFKSRSSATFTGSVLLKNPTSKAHTIELGAVDAITAQTGGSAFETADVKPKGIASWLKFSESSITLPAGMQKPIDFTVTVPKSLKPGQYLAGISAYIPNIPPTAGANQGGTPMGANITIQTRYVIAVQVDVEGAWTPSLHIESVNLVEQPSGPFIAVQMKNDGDTFLQPSGAIVLTDTAGKRVLDQPLAMGTFIPGTATSYPVKWTGELKAGDYEVSVAMKYGDNATAYYNNRINIRSASKVVVPNPAEQGQQPGSIAAIDDARGQIGSIEAEAARVSEQFPHNIPVTERWLVVLFSGLALAAAAVLAVTIRRARQKKSLARLRD